MLMKCFIAMAKKPLGLHAARVGDAVVAADGDHEAVVVGLEVVALAAVDVGDDVLRGGLGGEVGGLDDLGHGLAVEHEAGVVADDVDEGVLRCDFISASVSMRLRLPHRAGRGEPREGRSP